MNTFTASNGYGVALTGPDVHDAQLRLLWGSGAEARVCAVSTQQIDALREFFRAEEDKRLDRVRSQDDPDIVIYPLGPDKVRVVNESSHGAADTFRREDLLAVVRRNGGPLGPMGHAASRFFDAHPEPKPIPSEPHTAWVDKYGTDIWVVDFRGVLRCVANSSSDPVKYAPFTRLVPEVSE